MKTYSIAAQIGLVVCLTAAWTNDAPSPEPGAALPTTMLDPGFPTELEVGAFRSSSWPRDTLVPTSLPYSGTHEVVNVDEISNATYQLTDTSFKIEFNHIGNSVRTRTFNGRPVTIQDGASTTSSVRFTVDVDTAYAIVGQYNASGLRAKYFSVNLGHSSSTLPDFESTQVTEAGATAAQTFVVGGTDGTHSNALQGAQTGMLRAGERYTFWISSVLNNQVGAPPATEVGSGSATMYVGPVVSSYAPFGAGCAGSSGAPVLGASSAPQIGSSFAAEVTNIPMDSTAQLLVFGFSDTDWAGMTLPAPLSSIGLWNCTLYISAEIGVPMVKNGTSATYSFTVPNNLALLGKTYFNQALIHDFGAPNPQQSVVSNAVRGVVGGM